MIDIEEIRELSARQVDRLLKRGNGWAARHAEELGGYEDEGRLRFTTWGIQRWQRRKEEATR